MPRSPSARRDTYAPGRVRAAGRRRARRARTSGRGRGGDGPLGRGKGADDPDRRGGALHARCPPPWRLRARRHQARAQQGVGGSPRDARGPACRRAVTRAATIRGRVIDATSGAPLARVLVTASHSVASDRRIPSASDQTATDGTFELTLTRDGDYDLRAYLEPGLESAESPDGYVSQMLTRVKSGSDPLTLALERALSIRGRLIDEAGKPVRVRVSVDAVGLTADGEADYTRRQQSEAQDGQFAVRALAPGLYRVQFQPAASPFSESPASVVLGAVEAGTHDLVVRLPIGLMLRGRSSIRQGSPSPTSSDASEPYPKGRRSTSLTVGGRPLGDGTFNVGPLATGRRWDVHFTGFAGFRPHVERGVDPRSEGITIRSTRGGRIQGRVVLAGGQPAPGRVPVGLQSRDPGPGNARSAHLHLHGRRRDVCGGRPPRGRIRGRGRWRDVRLPRDVTAHDVQPGATDVVLRVVEGVDLVGFLVNDRNQAVAATSLQADDGMHIIAMRPYVQVGPDGRFRLRGLAPGKVRLSIRRSEHWVALGEFTAPATDLRVVVPPP